MAIPTRVFCQFTFRSNAYGICSTKEYDSRCFFPFSSVVPRVSFPFLSFTVSKTWVVFH